MAKRRLRSDDLFSPASRRNILKFCASGIILYSVVVLIYANIVPYLGLEVFPSLQGGAEGQERGSSHLVHAVRVEPVAGQAPQVGDVVLSVAGVKLESLPLYVNTIANLFDSKRFPADAVSSVDRLRDAGRPVAEIGTNRYVRLEFRRAAPQREQFFAWFKVSQLPWQIPAVSVVWGAMESLVFWMGWVVFRRRPEDDSAALFFLMCIVTVGAYMGGYHWLQIASSPALLFIFALCAMAVPQVSLHFFLVFPTPKAFVVRYPRAVLIGLYILPAFLEIAILWAIGSVVSTFRHEGTPTSIGARFGVLSRLIWVYLALGGAMFAGCLVSLWHSLRNVGQPIQKIQVRWIFRGAMLASLFIFYSLWLAVRDPTGFALGGATWAMFASSVAFTAAYVISIARYRLIHVDDILRRGVVYLLVTFFGSLCYYGMLLLTIWFAPKLTTDVPHGQVLIVSTVIIFVLLILSTIRSRVQMVLDRRFYREKHQLDRAIRRMDEAVGGLVDRDTVLRRGLLVMSDLLSATEGAIYLRDGGGFRLAHQLGPRDFPEYFRSDHEVVGLLERDGLLQTHPGPVLPGDATTPALRRLGVELAQPFQLDAELVGFALLGAKEAGMYSSAELDFLSGLAELTTMALKSAEMQGTLESLNEDLRAKVARVSRQKEILALQAQEAAVEEPRPIDDEPAVRSDLIKGSSPEIASLIASVRKIAGSSATVLIRGESGTGKSLLAEVIHRNSPRADGPFVKVHCAALSPGVLESELFGHVKGAFTGAHRDKVGRFQAAHGGTLFLDEIGDITLDVQTKLLRVLQEMTFEPVGSSDSITVDVRLITATHQPLEELVRRGRLREDLFYRLNVISMHIPPLRERREDVFELALFFLRRYAEQSGKQVTSLDEEVLERLHAYDWPGNIRELENVIERAVVMTGGPTILFEDLPPELRDWSRRPDRIPLRSAFGAARREGMGSPLTSEIDDVERSRILEALAAGEGNKTKAARLLGIPRTTLVSKLKRLGLQ